MAWLIRAVDAWLSNQPREGAIAREGEPQHPEARACIACDVTQFSTRAYLTAVRNGFLAPNRRRAIPSARTAEIIDQIV